MIDNSQVCGFCKSKKLNVFMKFNGFNLMKCKGCAIVTTQHGNHIDTTNKKFDSEYLDKLLSNSAASDIFFKKNSAVIKEYLQHGKLLDVGFGAGHFLAEMAGAGYDVYGVEISESACEYVKQKYGIGNVVCGSFLNLELDKKVDMVTFWDSLQYVESPMAYLVKANACLEDDGLVVVQVPNRGRLNMAYARFLYRISSELARVFLHIPAAVTLFNEHSLEKVLGTAGFKLLEVVNNPTVKKFRWSGNLSLKSIVVNVIENVYIAIARFKKEKESLIAIAKKV
ncbi:MAG: class I SAM-dependent methyltransferase [Clostridia bacterium]|nr:class I SAM-dependent methyltransferase [Clostridia bacterium]